MIDESAVQVESLRCLYDEFTAVDGISFTVAPGEVFALLGTNGAGKTTTLETLEGHRHPDGGRVRLLGLDPHRQRRRVRRRVGIMLQESGFPGDLTVAETMSMSSRLRAGRPPYDPALERVDLAHRRSVRVSSLSGGEKRRLELAIAILGEPRLLFLDEPTSGMDPESRNRTLDIVRELVAAGTTVVMTTHYLEEAEMLADRVAIMHEGQIPVMGTKADVLSRQPSRIAFRTPEDKDGRVRAELECRTGSAIRAGDQWVLETSDLQGDLTRLLSWASGRGVRLEHLNAHHASLDDVFRAVVRGEFADEHPVEEMTAPTC